VLSRIFDIDRDIEQTGVIRELWEQSGNLLAESEDPYHYNQAIMELGATVCLPQNPRCLLCPVKKYCTAFARGTQHDRPVKKTKKPTPHHVIAVGVIWHENRVLIQQRPEEGLLGNLWEFPGGKQEPGETLQETVRREIEEELGIEVLVRESIAVVKHAYTHFKITLHAYHCQYQSGVPQPKACQAWHWVSPDELGQYAFPKANKTVLETMLAEWKARQPTPVSG
jgi:A/G-specific adenine glycosylase